MLKKYGASGDFQNPSEIPARPISPFLEAVLQRARDKEAELKAAKKAGTAKPENRSSSQQQLLPR